jgi:hypothetical protein
MGKSSESTLAAIGQLATTDQVTHPEGFVPKERDKYWKARIPDGIGTYRDESG